jgi:hypothetical protein
MSTKGIVLISNVMPDEIDKKFGGALRDLVKRKTKQFDTLLTFSDVWADESSAIPKGLF